MITEAKLAIEIARLVALWHLVVATYLVFVSERSSPGFMAIAILKGVLGGCIYLIVLKPEWAFLTTVEGLLLPFTLLLLGAMSVALTWLIWQHYELDPPLKRVHEIVEKWRERLRREP